MGFQGILTEGADHILNKKSPNLIYGSKNGEIKLLLKNYRLSDDLAFRFSEKSWKEWPLTVPKYTRWLNAVNGNGQTMVVNKINCTWGALPCRSTGFSRKFCGGFSRGLARAQKPVAEASSNFRLKPVLRQGD